MTKQMTDAQLAYERKRAAKANKPLDQWLKDKAKSEPKTTAPKPDAVKKPSLIKRLIERGHQPLTPKK